jgi:hypothetical protein
MGRIQISRAKLQGGERRSAVRYRMAIKVICHWNSNGNDRSHAEGFTRDISVAGAHVFCEVCPPLNALVYVELLLPRSGTAATPRMTAKMRVVRVDKESHQLKSGFSVRGKNFALLSTAEPRPFLLRGD